MRTNRQYKDSVFSLLFNNPDALRDLYGALQGAALAPDVPVTVNTLSDALFMERINDLSFLVDKRLVILIEHQSTINPNMALRLLLYIARIYEKILAPKKLYASSPLVIPFPEFIVLYNGDKPYPDRQTLKLSDMFEQAGRLSARSVPPPRLELTVQVYNVNKGHNEALLGKSKLLGEYSDFIERIRECEREGLDRAAAIQAAIGYCLEQGILQEFLRNHSSEVFNMLLTEWNWDDFIEVREKEAEQKGREETARKALAKGLPLDTVSDITGFDREALKRLSRQESP